MREKNDLLPFLNLCVSAGVPPNERWPFSGEQTRHLSKVLHHLGGKTLWKCALPGIFFAVIFSLRVTHKIQTSWQDLKKKEKETFRTPVCHLSHVHRDINWQTAFLHPDTHAHSNGGWRRANGVEFFAFINLHTHTNTRTRTGTWQSQWLLSEPTYGLKSHICTLFHQWEFAWQRATKTPASHRELHTQLHH